MKVFSDDQVAAMHEAALVDARDAGHEGAVRRCSRVATGAPAPRSMSRRKIVRLDRGLVAAVARDDAARDHAARASTRSATCRSSKGCVAFAPTSGPPNIMDTARGRRAGHVRGFLQSDEAVPELRGDSRARRRDRAAGRAGAGPASARDARAAHAVPTRSPSSSRAATARSPTTSSSSAWRTASRPRSSARAPTSTPSSTPIRRCSSTFRWPTASSISRRRARCSSSRRSRSPERWRR